MFSYTQNLKDFTTCIARFRKVYKAFRNSARQPILLTTQNHAGFENVILTGYIAVAKKKLNGIKGI